MKERQREKQFFKQRGIAIISVLMMSVVMLALAGAFFATHKTDLALMGTSYRLENTKNAALSAADFFEYKLQNDSTFGAASFEDVKVNGTNLETFPPKGDPLMEIEYFGVVGSPFQNRVVGKILATNLEFEGWVCNNLNTNTVAQHERGEVPPRAARVWIETRQGHIKKRMDFILKRSPFSSVSMLSGGDIDVSLAPSEDGHWWLGARQPSGNAVRANGTIIGPEVLSKTGRAVLFEPPDGMDKLKAPYGVIQAPNLRMQLDGVMTDVEASTSPLGEIKDNILGVLSPGSSKTEIPKLDPGKLTAPALKINLPNQVEFSTQTSESGVTTHTVKVGSETRSFVQGSGYGREYVTSGVRFDLEARTMTIEPNVEVQVDGQFSLIGDDNAGQPTLVLGNDVSGASLTADGINIEGSVGGKGALKSMSPGEAKSALKVRAKSSLSTTPDYGVALHSDGDVVLSRPGSSKSDGTPADWGAFSAGIKKLEPEKREQFDNWIERKDGVRTDRAAELGKVVLTPAGTVAAGDDPVWLALVSEFELGPGEVAAARAAYEKWTQKAEPAVMMDDPDYVPPDPPEHPLIEQLDAEGNPVLDVDGNPVMIPDPEWSYTPPPVPQVVEKEAIPAGPGFDVDKYVRTREYLKSAKEGRPDDTWLSSGRTDDVTTLVKNQLTTFQLAAGQKSIEQNGQVVLEWNSLSGFLSLEDNPFLVGFNPDMRFRGLIYAGQNFKFDTENLGFELEGALVAQGNIEISEATGARFIYNSELLENLFATNEGDKSAKLERSFWAYY